MNLIVVRAVDFRDGIATVATGKQQNAEQAEEKRQFSMRHGCCRTVDSSRFSLVSNSLSLKIPNSRIAGPTDHETNLANTRKRNRAGKVWEIKPVRKAIAKQRKGCSPTSFLSSLK